MIRSVVLLVDEKSAGDPVAIALKRGAEHCSLRFRSVGLYELVSVLTFRFAWALRDPGDILAEHFGVSGLDLLINRLIGDINEYGDRIGDFRLMAAVDRWIRRFPKRTSSPGLYSLAGCRLPLNIQWLRVNSEFSELATPSFEFGVSSEEISVSHFREPLDKSPYDLFNWTTSAQSANRENRFVVDRPKGVPYVVSFLGSSSMVTRLSDCQSVHGDDEQRLSAYGMAIGSLFGHSLGQALFFVEADSIMFVAFVPDHKGIGRMDMYSEWLERALRSWCRSE